MENLLKRASELPYAVLISEEDCFPKIFLSLMMNLAIKAFDYKTNLIE